MHRYCKKLLICAALVTVSMTYHTTGVYGESWADTSIQDLVKKEVFDKTPQDITRAATREEFCVMLSKAFYDGQGKPVALPFEDQAAIAPQNIQFLSPLYKAGVLLGSTAKGKTYMRPKEPLTRQEAVTFIGRIINEQSTDGVTFIDDAHIAPYAYPYISRFVQAGVVRGYPDGSFQPERTISMAEAAELIHWAMLYQQTNQVQLKTYFGTGQKGAEDGATSVASMSIPEGLCIDSSGNLTVFDTFNATIRKISGATMQTVAGSAAYMDAHGFAQGYAVDGDVDKALLNRPTSGRYNSKGALVFADSENNSIRVYANKSVYTLCGGTAGYADGDGKVARFNFPYALDIDSNDNIYVADTMNHVIRKIDKDGKTTTIAGVAGTAGYADGDAASALFHEPMGIAVAPNGVLYVSDTGNSVIRKIENGHVTTLAGKTPELTADEDYAAGGYQDGMSQSALFLFPKGITLADDVVVVADSGNHCVRAILPEGEVMTLAGHAEVGDQDGPARTAQMNKPTDVCYRDGHLYVTDSLNNKVKVLDFNPSVY